MEGETRMDWKYLFTSFEGRIGRQSMWMGIIVLIVISIIIAVLDSILGTRTENGIGILGALFSLAAIYPSLALYAKRWHDRGKSGWWSLILLVPIIGALWVLIELGFLPGIEGPNQYGADPVAVAA
jgi:uncharacterized membrane protein YhaH (DUF805 family)